MIEKDSACALREEGADHKHLPNLFCQRLAYNFIAVVTCRQWVVTFV
jgi:hypothetical protein